MLMTISTNPVVDDEGYKGLTCRTKKHRREYLMKHGTRHLPDEEFLALLIFGHNTEKAVNVAENVLKAFDNDLAMVVSASINELMQVKGIGFVRACNIKVAFELGKRAISFERYPKITSKEDVVRLLAMDMKFLKQEEFRVLLLDGKKRMIRHCRIALGTVDKAFVHPRDVFRPALDEHAKSIILVHNHPSGDPAPSQEDILLTKELFMGGVVLGVEVLDHIIIGFSKHVSLKEKGII
ncbi:MAG: DNA repair protein RadC [Theionarchaea archaeon]|nr:DNA repair protein RadC [Theionarchaea archaeon]